jgi:hypothetical protein
MNAPVPIRPDREARSRSAMRNLTRAVWAMGASVIDKSLYASEHARKALGDDYRDIEKIIRAAVAPTDSTTALMGYAQVFLKALAPVAASPALIDHVAGLPLHWPEGVGHLSVPAVSMSGLAKFVAEGGPIPVPTGLTSSIALQPFKLALIVALTREVFQYTAAEPMIEKAISESVGSSLDGLMFTNAAGVPGVQPPGLMYNVVPLAATPISTNTNIGAMYSDMSALGGAVSPVAGNDAEGICFIMAGPQAVFARLRCTDSPYPIFASAALPAGMVIAVAARAKRESARDPRFEVRTEPSINLETAPLAIGTPGTPPTVAAPTMSLWQADAIGVRFLWPLNWGLRDARGIAWIQTANW